VLIDHARARGREKRGGDRLVFGSGSLDSLGSVADLASQKDPEEIVAFDGAFQRLEGHQPRCAAVVRLRFYAGLSIEQTALALGISQRTVNSDWAYARAWLARELRDDGGADEGATE
jgi:RNA polymerase sigma factor (TIGR02999 family)